MAIPISKKKVGKEVKGYLDTTSYDTPRAIQKWPTTQSRRFMMKAHGTQDTSTANSVMFLQ